MTLPSSPGRTEGSSRLGNLGNRVWGSIKANKKENIGRGDPKRKEEGQTIPKLGGKKRFATAWKT